MKKTIGPVQLLAIGFDPKAKFEGKILKELEKLDSEKTIRILDLLFVQKDEKSKELIALSYQGEELGSIVGALLGFEFDETEDNGKKTLPKKINNKKDNYAFGLSSKQIERIGESLDPGMAAGILLIEHVWARELKHVIREAGGVPIAEGFITPEAIATVALEIEALTEVMNEMEDAEGHEKSRMQAYN